MICFEICLNGERVCLAGIKPGVVSSNLTSWQADFTSDREPQIHLHVAGSSEAARLRWTEPGEVLLKVGDEVTVRVVEADTPDEPARHYSEPKS